MPRGQVIPEFVREEVLKLMGETPRRVSAKQLAERFRISLRSVFLMHKNRNNPRAAGP